MSLKGISYTYTMTLSEGSAEQLLKMVMQHLFTG